MNSTTGFVAVAAFFAFVALKVAPQLADMGGKATAEAAVATTAAAPAPVSAGRPRGGYKVVIQGDGDGHYLTKAVVNGHTLDVIVDTGATFVSLSADDARRLGVTVTPDDYTELIATANGTIAAAEVTLRQVRVGAISVDNVKALIVPDNALGVNLLGMSFLNRLTRFEAGGGQLILTD